MPRTGGIPVSPSNGAPGQVEQEGLRIVIGIVGGGDLVSAQLLGGGGEKAVAHGAGGFLHPFALFLGLLGHVAPTHHQGDTPLLAPLDTKSSSRWDSSPRS